MNNVSSDIPLSERLTANFTRGRRSYDRIFLHATRGPGERSLEDEYRATVNYFLRDGTASAHFVVGPSSVTRMVRDGDSAWHALENNDTSLAIEIAQPSTQPDFTDFQYAAVAAIVDGWCAAYGIPRQRVMSQYERGILGHDDSESGKRDGKTDPGPKWDWEKFLSLLNGESGMTEADRKAALKEMDDLWFVAQKLDEISAHNLASEVRQSVLRIKQVVGLNT